MGGTLRRPPHQIVKSAARLLLPADEVGRIDAERPGQPVQGVEVDLSRVLVADAVDRADGDPGTARQFALGKPQALEVLGEPEDRRHAQIWLRQIGLDN